MAAHLPRPKLRDGFAEVAVQELKRHCGHVARLQCERQKRSHPQVCKSPTTKVLLVSRVCGERRCFEFDFCEVGLQSFKSHSVMRGLRSLNFGQPLFFSVTFAFEFAGTRLGICFALKQKRVLGRIWKFEVLCGQFDTA